MKPNLDFRPFIFCAILAAIAYIVIQWLFPSGAFASIQTLGLVIGWGGAILIGLIGLAVVYNMFTGAIDLSKLVSETNGDASMSRFQFLIFTFVISLCLLVITVSNATGPKFPDKIPPEILGLLGISAGSYVVSKSLQNNLNASTTATTTGVSPSSTTATAAAPSVTLTPASVAVVAGQTATLTAAAAGAGLLAYEWQRAVGGATDWQILPNQGLATLTLSLSIADNGTQYRCKVTNAAGSVLSGAVAVTVTDDRG